jgi:uncharacterized membrane protein
MTSEDTVMGARAEGAGSRWPSSQRLEELFISVLPRLAAAGSLLLIFVGMALTLARQPAVASADLLKGVGEGTSAFPHTIASVVRELRQADGPAVVMAGILLLLVTPALRVAGSIVAFAHQRDRTFVVISCLVIALLILSLLVGRAGG